MNEIEMRFDLVSRALDRGHTIEDAMLTAAEAVHFAVYGEPKREASQIVSYEVEDGMLTLRRADGGATTFFIDRVGVPA